MIADGCCRYIAGISSVAAVHVPFLAVLAGKGPSSVTGGHSDGHDDDDDREHDNPDCNKKQAT